MIVKKWKWQFKLMLFCFVNSSVYMYLSIYLSLSIYIYKYIYIYIYTVIYFLTFFCCILQADLKVWNSKSSRKVWNKNKQGMLFWPKLAQKWILGSEIWKSNSDLWISSSEIPCVLIFRQILCANFDSFDPNLPKNNFWGQNLKNLSLDSESAPPRYYVCHFLRKTHSFDFFSPSLPENGFRVGNSKS